MVKCVRLSHSIALLLDIMKITSLISISFYDISLRKKKSLTFISLFPLLLLPLPKPTEDNHPKAKLSIKTVTLFHSHRVIHGITHANQSNTKLFLNSPVRKINPPAHKHINVDMMCTTITNLQDRQTMLHTLLDNKMYAHACIIKHICYSF